MKILRLAAAAGLLAVGASAQTVELRRDVDRLDRRVRELEAAPTIRVLEAPGMVPQQWTTVPGWRTLELVPAGGTTFQTTTSGKTVRVVARSQGAGGSLSVSNGLFGDGYAAPLRVRLGAGLAFDGAGAVAAVPPEYLWLPGGLTLGSNAFTNAAGTLRWDPATTNVQFHDGSAWRAFGLGSSSVTNFGWGLAGSGTTNPLSVDPTVFVNTNLGFGLIGSGLEGDPLRVDQDQVAFQLAADRLPGAYLAWDDTNYVSVYGPRTALWASEAASLHGATGLPATIYPGQLVYQDLVPDGSRHVYVCTNAFAPTNFAYGDLSWLPAGGNDFYWRIFVPQGPRGERGATGNSTDGLDGVGNALYGIWDNNKPYAYDTGTPIVVSYGGRWYDCVADSSNYPPDAIGATNYWAISVDKGDDGEIVGWTNLTFRGNWDSGESYATNDAVWYGGNLFAVGETNVAPGLGAAPSLDSDLVGRDSANWTALVWRGARGFKGEDGDAINSYAIYSVMPGTNTLFDNLPSSVQHTPRWVSQSGDQAEFTWAEHPRSGTNELSVTNGALRINGASYPAGRSDSAIRDLFLAGSAGCIEVAVADADSTVSLSTTNKAYRVRVAAPGTITNWVVTGVSTAALDWCAVVLEPGAATDFSWKGLRTNVAPAAAHSTNVYFIWRGPGSDYWTVD